MLKLTITTHTPSHS